MGGALPAPRTFLPSPPGRILDEEGGDMRMLKRIRRIAFALAPLAVFLMAVGARWKH
jgi:hypothetical protein